MISPEKADDVRELQRLLNLWGFAVPQNGRFGPLTESAVKEFQKQKSLQAEGVVGAKTWSALKNKEPKDVAGAWSAADSDGVPWYSQFDGTHVKSPGNKACLRACQAMLRAVGAVSLGSSNRIQVATSEDSHGGVEVDKESLAEAIKYIDSELKGGRPVIVGVSHSDKKYNVDRITDHYVVIRERVEDSTSILYKYHDPATLNQEEGTSHTFYVHPETGNLTHEGKRAEGYVAELHYEMSMVLKNETEPK